MRRVGRIVGSKCGYCGKVITKLDTGRGRGKVCGGWSDVWCSADCEDAVRFWGVVTEILFDIARRAYGV